MTIWYLGALRAMEEMADYMKDEEMAEKCRRLFEKGSKIFLTVSIIFIRS
jgi:non-lysosomal glucosylceramidase